MTEISTKTPWPPGRPGKRRIVRASDSRQTSQVTDATHPNFPFDVKRKPSSFMVNFPRQPPTGRFAACEAPGVEPELIISSAQNSEPGPMQRSKADRPVRLSRATRQLRARSHSSASQFPVGACPDSQSACIIAGGGGIVTGWPMNIYQAAGVAQATLGEPTSLAPIPVPTPPSMAYPAIAALGEEPTKCE